jgi:hypoxanthine phosphoribosyltransferase
MRRELLTWNDVDKLIDHLIPQFEYEYDGMVIITRGGIVPGGLLAAALQLENIVTASVDFPAEAEMDIARKQSKFMYWPKFIQFPDDEILNAGRFLVVDDVWGSGRTITAVKNRVTGLGGLSNTCVLHFNPYRNLFGNVRPDYYAATTDAYIVYPWESQRDRENPILRGFG